MSFCKNEKLHLCKWHLRLRPVVELLDLSEADDEAEDAQQVDDGVGDLGQVFNDILSGWKKQFIE